MAVNKVIFGNNTLIDLTNDTATAADVASGKFFHLPDGSRATGTASTGPDERLLQILKTGGALDLSDMTTLTHIGNLLNYRGASFTSIILPSTVTKIDSYGISQNGLLTSINLDNITRIELSAFSGCARLALTSLPSGLTTLGSTAFQSCSALAIKTIPSGVATIPSNCFNYCTGITELDIPATVSSVEGGAFSYCSGLKKLKIRAATLGTGNYSSSIFTGSTQLTKVWISSNCTRIYANSATYAPFTGCSSLRDIYCEANSQPSNWQSYWNNYSSSAKCTVHWGVSEATFDALAA